MFFNICLPAILLWWQCIQINAQCTTKGCESNDVVSGQATANDIFQLLNRLDNQGQNLQQQLQKLLNQTGRQVRRCENEVNVTTQDITDQILQLQNQTVQLLCRKLLTQFGRQDLCDSIAPLRDCSDIRDSGHNTSGMYPVYVEHEQKLYSANASCDMTSSNGTSWLVFQRRKNGNVDFYRKWIEYENGFGDPNGEFWLGNKMLHLLTSKRNYKLRVELEDFEGNRRFAEYASFSVGSPADNYRLNIGGYSGDAGDSLSKQDGSMFSTKDADNDITHRECAVRYHGAWWYELCSRSQNIITEITQGFPYKRKEFIGAIGEVIGIR